MKRNMKEYKELTAPVCPVPNHVQDLIPIYRIAENGIFELEKKPDDAMKLYDKAYLFADTNFATMDDYEKSEFLKLWCVTLNSLGISFKIVIMNNNRDMEQVRRKVFLYNKEPRFQKLAESFNEHMERAMLQGNAGIEQARIFIMTCRRQTMEQAGDYFRSLEANLAVNFDRLQSSLIPLNAEDRLRYLHAFYRLGEEGNYQFSFRDALQHKADWRDFISPRIVKHYQDEYGTFDGKTVQIDGHYVRALYVPQLPNSINPDIVHKLTAGPYHVILTCDVEAIPTDVARKRLMDLYMQNGRAIEKQQETRNKAMAWSSDITYDRRREREELESYMDILNENDEKMYYLGLYAIISADSKKQLENDVVAFCAAAEGDGFSFWPARWEQLAVINTALPVGGRYCDVMAPVFTQPLSAITPFIVSELYQPGGIFYGINQVSKNVLIGNRKKLKNGNGFVLGVTGAGKGMDTKQEIVQVFLNTTDDIIVIDPQNEYKILADYLGGQFVDFGSDTGHYLNPLDINTLKYMDTNRTFRSDKTELMLGIYSQIMPIVTAQEKSIIGRCVDQVYAGIDHPGFQAPTFVEYYQALKAMPEPQAHELALALELFTTGALNMFARPTNVNINNRLMIFGIQNLGKEQAGIGSLIMLEHIRARIAENAAKGKATWLYIDEFHNLASQDYSARYLEKIWKEVRKLGGLCTAMTQNIADLLATKIVETMLCNSEYLSLLNQSDVEIDILKRLFGISDNLLEYVHNVPPGCGLLKFGGKYIPKDGRLPKDSEMYRLFNTNFHEIQEMREKKRRKMLKDHMAMAPELIKEEIERDPTDLEKVYL